MELLSAVASAIASFVLTWLKVIGNGLVNPSFEGFMLIVLSCLLIWGIQKLYWAWLWEIRTARSDFQGALGRLDCRVMDIENSLSGISKGLSSLEARAVKGQGDAEVRWDRLARELATVNTQLEELGSINMNVSAISDTTNEIWNELDGIKEPRE